MKFIHVSDLHLGKKLNAYSLLNDQKHFLNVLLSTLIDNDIHLLLISGDIFDNYNPSNDALSLFDETLKKLKDNNITTMIITGNHDSSAKVNYLTSFLKDYSIYIKTDLTDFNKPITIEDTDFYLIPYVSYNDINDKFNTSFKDNESAYKYLIDQINIDENKNNVLLAHQTFIPINNELERSGSEDIVIGMIPNISTSIISKFDYAALGHIHKAQKISNNAYYSGSPLVFHKDEINQKKNIKIIELENHKFSIKEIEFKPLRKVRLITDYFENIKDYIEYQSDYIYFVLKDTSIINNAINKIKLLYPYALSLEYEINRDLTDNISSINIDDIERKDINDIFASFFNSQNNEIINDEQKEIIKELFIEVKKKYEAD